MSWLDERCNSKGTLRKHTVIGPTTKLDLTPHMRYSVFGQALILNLEQGETFSDTGNQITEERAISRHTINPRPTNEEPTN